MIDNSSLSKLPSISGIYQFCKNGKPIYIGKSVNIKARVLSHLQSAKLSMKEALIVNESDNLLFIETMSDFDAIVLEAKLIKKYRPKYNIALKDDKHFLYIKITVRDKYPKVFPVRAENDKKSLYFGPFSSTETTNKLLYHLRRIIPFCTQKKIGKQACFYSRIGLCNPCPSLIERQDEETRNSLQTKYKSNIKTLIQMLKGESKKIIKDLELQLKTETDSGEYEKAILTRDRILSINKVLYTRSFSKFDDTDYSKIAEVESEFRDFIHVNFNKTLKRGKFRIECFDVSTLFLTNSTGSMVVFENGSLNSSHYRRFKIKSKPMSDFDAISEVLKRRFNQTKWRFPDLIIIDGGKPQLNATSQVLNLLGLNIPLIGLAKNPDRIVYNTFNIKRKLRRSSKLFKCFQQIRDESHRFAKKYHVYLRNKSLKL